jgi:putative ABC transport system permease protein
MTGIGELFRRVWYLLNRRRLDDLLRQEMEAHREMMDDPGRFGSTLRLREESAEAWGWIWLDTFLRDVRWSLRALRKTPSFTIVTVASLTIGLALTASTVAIINAYLIRGLPYGASDRLFHVMYAPPGPWEPAGMSGLDWKSVDDVVEYPIAASGEELTLGEGGARMSVRGFRARRGFVEGLGVRVTRGRPLGEDDFVAKSERVALIGHALWRDRFGSDAGILGRLIRAEADTRSGQSETFRIVGVLSPGFYFGRDSRATVDLLIPDAAPARVYMVRLHRRIPPEAAERRITEAARRASTSPIPENWTGVRLESAHERYVGSIRPVLLGVTVAVILVLVIVCANVAVLILLRSMRRQKEIAVRLALGSGRREIARMLLMEISLISAAALTAGLAITVVLLRALAPLVETQIGRPAPNAAGIVVDTAVLSIVGGLTVLVALLLSLVPLLSWDRGLMGALRQDGRVTSDGPSMQRIRHALIALEVAGSLVLLVGCGLMIRSVVTMMTTDLGFDMHGLQTSRVMLRPQNYPDAAAYRRFHQQFADRVARVTGSPVAFSSWPPFFLAPTQRIEAQQGGAAVSAGGIAVSGDYFAAFRIPIRQGRTFSPDEASGAAPVAVISETLANALWPGGAALGRQLRGIEPTPAGPTAGPWRTVVGIAADVRQTYDDTDRRDFYTPKIPDGRYGTFYVRTNRRAPLLVDDLRSIAADIDREAVINEPRSVADNDEKLEGARFVTLLLTGFAAIAAFLAMLGVYGVTAYAVQQRYKELAIRIALGASGRLIVRMFLLDGARLLGMGTALGLVGAASLSRVLANYIFGVESFDVYTHVGASALLLAAGFGATWWPARRAVLWNPVSTLNAS